jgi:phosphate transport system substrate-binding protein
VIVTYLPGETSWPIRAATFILMHKIPVDLDASKGALKFFDWAYKNGDKMAAELDYIPMPDNVVADVEKMWAADIKDSAGKPVFAMN